MFWKLLSLTTVHNDDAGLAGLEVVLLHLYLNSAAPTTAGVMQHVYVDYLCCRVVLYALYCVERREKYTTPFPLSIFILNCKRIYGNLGYPRNCTSYSVCIV